MIYLTNKNEKRAQNRQPISWEAVGIKPSIQILELAESIGPRGFK